MSSNKTELVELILACPVGQREKTTLITQAD